MGAGEAAAIAAALVARGNPATLPVAVVENASLPEARHWFTTLGALPALADQAFRGPVLLLLGEVLADAAARDAPHADFLRTAAAHLLRA
jgi:uroporphyrin-III C-methyltransferase